jgi:hypothetical protein
MLLTVAEFRKRVDQDIDALVVELQEQTGRENPDEIHAWKASLPTVSHAFSAPAFQPLHLYFGERGQISLEYRLPSASSWCDMVLLGSHEGNQSAVIVELKDWQTRSDVPGPIEGIMIRHGIRSLHPSEQVKGYVEYCRRFHSAVLDAETRVHGCVLFTRDRYIASYREGANKALADEFPCFAATTSHVDDNLVPYFGHRLTAPDERFARAFEDGVYRQNRSFVRQIGQQILTPNESPFELLDNQRLGFALCRSEIDKALFGSNGVPRKKVILVEGPPGSGKSVIAAKLWASLATDSRMADGDFVLTTTSKAQETNWKHLFEATQRRGAGGVVMPANQYAPATVHELGRLQTDNPGRFSDTTNWRESLRLLRGLRGDFRMPDDKFLVSVVDEAHALINPEHGDARGRFGWPTPLGPQAYHIIRASTISIFLLDPEQSFRERESTTQDDIKIWAEELGAEISPSISLAGAQFRCAGLKEYVEWVENMLRGDDPHSCVSLAGQWNGRGQQNDDIKLLEAAEPESKYGGVADLLNRRRPQFVFQLVNNPFELDENLRRHVLKDNASVRLVASFARPWKTKKAADPHLLAPEMQDFCFHVGQGTRMLTWARPWNVVPDGEDYTAFIQAAAGGRMSMDPLAEVGCPYAVRGFDFDYIGLIWLEDLMWRGGRWQVFPDAVHETGLKRMQGRAKVETDPFGPHHAELLTRIQQAYRILLTRAIKGVYVWCPDTETSERLKICLGRW